MAKTPLTPSLLVACLALAVVASGGIGYAAGALPRNSVGPVQLKKNAVTTVKLKDGAVSGVKVANGTLTGAKVADGSLTGVDLGANSVTGAQVDEGSLSIPLRPGSVLVSPADFAPLSSFDNFSTDGNAPYGIWGNNGVLTTQVLATVPLPAGATVTHITVYAADVDAAEDIEIDPLANAPATGTLTPGTPVLTSGATSGIQSITVPLLQPAAGAVLIVLVKLPSGALCKLYGARVDYS
jgi:hypothetical protein